MSSELTCTNNDTNCDKEINLLNKLNKYLEHKGKMNFVESIKTSSVQSKSTNGCSKIDDTRIIDLIVELEDNINHIQQKCQHIDHYINDNNEQIHSNLEKLTFIVTNHTKTFGEIKKSINEIYKLIDEIKLEQIKFKKMCDFLGEHDKQKYVQELEKKIINIVKDNVDIKTLIFKLQNKFNEKNLQKNIPDNSHKKYENCENEILKLKNELNGIRNEINTLNEIGSNNNGSEKSNSSNKSELHKKIMDLVTNYHNNTKQTVERLEKDIDNIKNKNKTTAIKIDIPNICEINCHKISNSDSIMICGQKCCNIKINDMIGQININCDGYDVMGNIEIYDINNNHTYCGFITNKQINDDYRGIIYVLHECDITDKSFDGYVKIDIKLVK